MMSFGADGRGRNRRRRWRDGLLALVLVITVAVPAVATASEPPWHFEFPPPRLRGTVTVGDQTLDVELALTKRERAVGLGYRDGLRPGTGMLFLYQAAEPKTFSMREMRFCLDIVFIDAGSVVGAAEGACPIGPGTPVEQRTRYRSPVPVAAVLEVPAGWLAANGLGVGSPVAVSLPADAPEPE